MARELGNCAMGAGVERRRQRGRGDTAGGNEEGHSKSEFFAALSMTIANNEPPSNDGVMTRARARRPRDGRRDAGATTG